jgi:hypothetical protein
VRRGPDWNGSNEDGDPPGHGVVLKAVPSNHIATKNVAVFWEITSEVK